MRWQVVSDIDTVQQPCAAEFPLHVAYSNLLGIACCMSFTKTEQHNQTAGNAARCGRNGAILQYYYSL